MDRPQSGSPLPIGARGAKLRCRKALLSAPLLALCCVGYSGSSLAKSQTSPDAGRQQARIPNLISSARLRPPLVSHVSELRFSSDGRYLLFQDTSYVYVIGLNPVRIQLSVPAAYDLPARFSKDSASVVVASSDMGVSVWSLSDGKLLNHQVLGDGGDCSAATLSPYGQYYACLDGYSILHVFDISTGREKFKGAVGQAMDTRYPFIVPLHRQTAFSQAFGYQFTNTPYFYPDLYSYLQKVEFSPDARYLVALGHLGHAEMVDLSGREVVHLSGAMRHTPEHDSFAFAGPNLIAAADADRAKDSALFSFPNGATVRPLDVSGTLASTGNAAYLIDYPENSDEGTVVSVQSGKPVATIAKSAADVWGDQLIYLTQDGVLILARIGGTRPELELRSPLSTAEILHAAAVSPGLKTFAVGVPGQGGIFDVATGQRRDSFQALNGAWCESDDLCYLQIPGEKPLEFKITTLNLLSNATSGAWFFANELVRNEDIFSGPVMLKHYAQQIYAYPDAARFPFELQALDAKTGKFLWNCPFGGDTSRINRRENVPVVFTDPQGDRVVLGWGAKDSGAQHAADRSPALRRALHGAKLSVHDSVFEVLDDRTGNFAGAALVQTGAGAESFNEAFSEGDWLILARAGRNIIAISLSTGAQIQEQNVYNPAISGTSNLLSAVADGGKLVLYDLKTNSVWAQYTFPTAVVYSHFSADGKRLLVLTMDQTVYVLDVSHRLGAAN